MVFLGPFSQKGPASPDSAGPSFPFNLYFTHTSSWLVYISVLTPLQIHPMEPQRQCLIHLRVSVVSSEARTQETHNNPVYGHSQRYRGVPSNETQNQVYSE